MSLIAVPRYTADVDAVLWDADDRLNELLQTLAEHGLTSRADDPIRFARQYRMVVLQDPEGIHVDLSLGALPFKFTAVANASSIDLGEGLIVPVASPEALIVMKTVASRPKDLEDIRSLLSVHPEVSVEDVRATVAEFADILEQPEILDRLTDLLDGR